MLEYLTQKVGREDAYKILSYYYDQKIGDICLKEHFDIDKCEIDSIIQKYQSDMPLNKIFGYEYFFGYKFFIDENVLAPRQDTERVVECVLDCISDGANVLDLCTGSGCIGIAIAKSKKVQLTLADMSSKALEIAKQNCLHHNITANIVQTDMFDNIEGCYDCIVSNPPYIRSNVIEDLDASVKNFDPLIALDGGEDGLLFYKSIRRHFSDFLAPKGVLVLEIGYDQAEDICRLFEGFDVTIVKDYGGNDRVAVIKRFLC